MHPEADVWSTVAAQTDLQLGERLNQFSHIVESKKKALIELESQLWDRVGQLAGAFDTREFNWPSEEDQDVEQREQKEAQIEKLLLQSSVVTNAMNQEFVFIPQEMRERM